eukprot:6211056-Karenia_brevis.AAC.1
MDHLKLDDGNSLGFVTRHLSHLIWADNCYLYSGTLEGIKKMLEQVTDALELWDLYWKPESLEIMACNVPDSIAETGQTLTIKSAKGYVWEFAFKDDMYTLGDRLDKKASSDTSLKHHMAKASATFSSKKPCLCDKRFSYKKRLDNFYRVAGSAFLFMSGSWHLTKTIALQIKAWGNRKLRK